MAYSTAIPFVDLRGKTPVDLLRAYPDRARDLIRATRRILGGASDSAAALALPFADRASHRWLRKNGNPYLYEIESFAELLRVRGVYAFNVCFEWGCTGGAFATGETVTLLRVLDWPFPALGKHMIVALQKGRAGDFYNATWPGMAGVFNAVAPGRFAAAVNQAPMRRHGLTFPGDWLKNRLLAKKATGLPPSHLLRLVCENAAGYDEAKAALLETPLALPAIFVLAGTRPGEGCVIERLEGQGEVIELGGGEKVTVANHFLSRLDQEGKGWRPRALDSQGRWRHSNGLSPYDLDVGDFSFVSAPILNVYTRLCLLADAASSRLMVQGFEGVVPVTPVFSLPTATHARKAV